MQDAVMERKIAWVLAFDILNTVCDGKSALLLHPQAYLCSIGLMLQSYIIILGFCQPWNCSNVAVQIER